MKEERFNQIDSRNGVNACFQEKEIKTVLTIEQGKGICKIPPFKICLLSQAAQYIFNLTHPWSFTAQHSSRHLQDPTLQQTPPFSSRTMCFQPYTSMIFLSPASFKAFVRSHPSTYVFFHNLSQAAQLYFQTYTSMIFHSPASFKAFARSHPSTYVSFLKPHNIFSTLHIHVLFLSPALFLFSTTTKKLNASIFHLIITDNPAAPECLSALHYRRLHWRSHNRYQHDYVT